MPQTIDNFERRALIDRAAEAMAETAKVLGYYRAYRNNGRDRIRATRARRRMRAAFT